MRTRYALSFVTNSVFPIGLVILTIREQEQTKVVGYIACRKIVSVDRMDTALTKHKDSFRILAKDKQQLVCLPHGDEPGKTCLLLLYQAHH